MMTPIHVRDALVHQESPFFLAFLDPELPILPDPLPISDAEIYGQELYELCNGYPLWIPESYGPQENSGRGVRIGDVGYITRSGAFESLFNICSNPDDAANYRGVPRNFERLSVPDSEISQTPFFHHPGSKIMNAKNPAYGGSREGVQESNLSGPVWVAAHTPYSEQTLEDAFLYLPNGATRFDCPPDLFREYIIRHAHNWDIFINETLGCHLPEGSIYLITACDKTNEWSLGLLHPKTAGREGVLDIPPLGLSKGRKSVTYRDGLPSPDSRSSDSETHCVFLQGFRITVRKKDLSSLGLDSRYNWFSKLTPRHILSISQKFSPRTAKLWRHRKRCAQPRDIATMEFVISKDSVKFEDISTRSLDWHPSVKWNRQLLDIFPDANVAFTHDMDIPRLNELYKGNCEVRLANTVRKNDVAFWNFLSK